MEFIKENCITAPKGFKAAGVYCGLRRNKTRKDLALIYSDVECKTVAVYTTNKVYGAPITVTREHLKNNKAKAIICNSGNANTCNADGVAKANLMCEYVANELGIEISDVLVASTGVIGQPLNVELIKDKVPDLIKELSEQNGENAAEAILTTDLIKKDCAVKFMIDDKEVTIGIIGKGSGMINPNMATLLGFITSDANISIDLLDEAFKEAINYSLNRVSVDGDTSTNDMVIMMANGLAENKEINTKNEHYNIFLNALKVVLLEVAKLVAKDGEGATKLIECKVLKAKTETDAVALAKSVIMSSLVKSAMFGNDANWGRILCALGYSGIDFDPNLIDVKFISDAGEIAVCEKGKSIDFSEELALKIIDQKEVIIEVCMNEGCKNGFAFGCDLTYEYVKINGSYRT